MTISQIIEAIVNQLDHLTEDDIRLWNVVRESSDSKILLLELPIMQIKEESNNE